MPKKLQLKEDNIHPREDQINTNLLKKEEYSVLEDSSLSPGCTTQPDPSAPQSPRHFFPVAINAGPKLEGLEPRGWAGSLPVTWGNPKWTVRGWASSWGSLNGLTLKSWTSACHQVAHTSLNTWWPPQQVHLQPDRSSSPCWHSVWMTAGDRTKETPTGFSGRRAPRQAWEKNLVHSMYNLANLD